MPVLELRGAESRRHVAANSSGPRAPGSAGRESKRSRLKPADRMVILLLDGEGWSTAEIAARMGWTRTNVKVRAHRARARLR